MEQPTNFSQAMNLVKKQVKESLFGPTIVYKNNEVSYSLLNYHQTLKYTDIGKITIWFGGDPQAFGRSRVLTLFIYLEPKDSSLQKIEIKQPLKRKLFTNQYYPFDTSFIAKVQKENPSVKIDQALLDYIKTGELKYLYATNTIYDKQFVPMFYIAFTLVGLMALFFFIQVVLKVLSSF
jgi:hypothetical protein